MNPLGVGAIVLLCTFVGALLGMWLAVLVEVAMHDSSKASSSQGKS